jgi:signal transduction histidine kinase
MISKSLSAQTRTRLEDTRSELGDLTAIFETILRIARIDAAHGTEMTEVFDLGALAAELGETFEVVAEESGQTLVLESEATAPLRIRGDAGMIGQLIVNLLQNAITHCPKGTFITLALRGTAAHVVLVVSDTGPGIADADRNRVFDAFFRTDTARTTEGSGLGMALVKSIADRHGAAIALEDNAPGLRVTVRFHRA